MRIQVKLMGHLRSHAPPEAKAGLFSLDLPDASTLAAIPAGLSLAPNQVHLLMRNGQRETDLAAPLAEGDLVTLFPPVAGG
jgi:molybdopterin converting factor small subunit